MRLRLIFVVSTGLWLAGCATSQQRPVAQAELASAPPQPYVRVSNANSNVVQLQVALRQFVAPGPNRPVIWLSSVCHIGEPSYFAQIQAHLDRQTLVLFEGIGPGEQNVPSQAEEAAAATSAPVGGAGGASADDHSSLQTSLAASLGLVFQLEAIDYRRANFRNSDLSLGQLRDLLARQSAASGEPGAGPSFESLIQMMQGGSWFDTLVQMGLRFLGANPKFQGLARLALLDLLGGIQGDLAHLKELPPEVNQLLEVLLQRRNERVLTDLKASLPTIGKAGSIAVFYGTGHMPDLEKHLRSDLHYRPAGDLWLTAFSVDLARSGISETERRFIEGLISSQFPATTPAQPGREPQPQR